MDKVKDIDNKIDAAIIKGLEYIIKNNISKGLFAGGIKDIVRDRYGIDDRDEVQERIRALYKKNILIEIEPSVPRKDQNKFYTLNENTKFNYVCGPLPSETELKETPIEIRRHHTEGLQDAIRTWIELFPDPNADYPFDPEHRCQDYIRKCQSHILYPDLKNHLPKMNTNVLIEWREYKKELMKLQKQREELLVFIKRDISQCFEFELNFIDDLERGFYDYDCNLLHKIIYDIVIDISGRVPGQEAYDNYEEVVNDFRANAQLIYFKSTVWWRKGDQDLIIVPKEEKDSLKAGAGRFLVLLDNINVSHLIKQGEEIIKNVTKLNKHKTEIIKELEGTLLFYLFPGECEYMA